MNSKTFELTPRSSPSRQTLAQVLAAAALVTAALASTPAAAGIQYGRDDWSNATSTPITVCGSPGCSPSQTCSPLFSSDPTIDTVFPVCINQGYALTFHGTWQPYGRTHHVGDVVNDPATGNAYMFVDVSVPTSTSNFFTTHPPLTDTLSWQPFSGLVPASSSGQGPAGPQGPAGAQGPKGDKGDTGPMGPQGADGAAGAAGAAGAQGPQGIQGPKGDTGPMGPQGAIGLTGPAGAQGPAGAAGVQGAKGDKGDTGPQGALGPTGPMGPAGAAGAVGPQGPKGDTGPAGATGASGVGLVPGAIILWPKGVPAPAGYTCAAQSVRFRHEDEGDVDHRREVVDDAATRWFRLCSKN